MVALMSLANLKLVQRRVIFINQLQRPGEGQKIDPLAEAVELVGAFVATPPKGAEGGGFWKDTRHENGIGGTYGLLRSPESGRAGHLA